MRLHSASKGPKFEKPTEEDMRESLVRLDDIEIWAAKAYMFEALPGYAGMVRRGVVGLFRDGRVVYMETRGLTATRLKPVNWWGRIEDLGKPVPAPKAFKAAKVLRVQRVDHRSLVLRIRGQPRIVCFTGLPTDKHLPKLLGAGKSAVEAVPGVGDVVGLVDMGASRARGAFHGREAVAAATVWRSVLDGSVSPETLPVLAAARCQS